MGVRVELNKANIGDILRSDEMQAMLKSHADRIAAAAGDGMVVVCDLDRFRWKASIITTTFEAMQAESEDKALTRALDAGRG